MNNTQQVRLDWFDRALKDTQWTGYNISGLESGSHKITGSAGINYPNIINPEYAIKLGEIGVRCVRLPFMLERLIPSYHPDNIYPANFNYIDNNYAKIIANFVLECEKNGVDVILDVHNYGQYYFEKSGGYTSNLIANYGTGNYSVLDSRYQINSANELEIRAPNDLTRLDPYEIVVGGSSLPYFADYFTYKAKIRANGGTGQVWHQAKMLTCYQDVNNFYEVSIGVNTSIVELAKTVNGIRTQLASTPYTYVANAICEISFALTNGVITVAIDNTLSLTAPVDPDLTYGKNGFFAAQAQINVIDYQLTCIDSSYTPESSVLQTQSVELAWGKTQGTLTYTPAIHKFFYTLIDKTFGKYAGIVGYDYNEPRDLAVGTNSSNYLTTSTCTIFQQAALDALRKLGCKKWFGWTSDDWGNAHNITSNITNGPVGGRWGPNFDLPFNDPLQRTFLTFHYYTDKYAVGTYNNSGTFGVIDNQTPIPYTNSEIDTQLDPLFKRWKQINIDRKANKKYPVPLFIGEIGSPESIVWNDTLDYTLEKFIKNGVGFAYFGIGKFLGNNPLSIMADFTEITNLGGFEIESLTKWQNRHIVVDKHLNKENLTLNPAQTSPDPIEEEDLSHDIIITKVTNSGEASISMDLSTSQPTYTQNGFDYYEIPVFNSQSYNFTTLPKPKKGHTWHCSMDCHMKFGPLYGVLTLTVENVYVSIIPILSGAVVMPPARANAWTIPKSSLIDIAMTSNSRFLCSNNSVRPEFIILLQKLTGTTENVQIAARELSIDCVFHQVKTSNILTSTDNKGYTNIVVV